MFELYHADCLAVLPSLPAQSIDLVVTDCPYRIVSGGASTIKRRGGREVSGILGGRNGWSDNVRKGKLFAESDIKFDQWLPEIFRVLKPATHCYIMGNARNLTSLQVQAEKVGFKFQNLLIWDKGNVTPNRYYMGAHECILMLRKGSAKTINNMGTSNILRVPNILGNKKHPTEKPVELLSLIHI